MSNTKLKLSNITIKDNGSVASSLANNMLCSKETTFSGIFINSDNASRGDNTLSSRLEKYNISAEIIAKIAEVGMKDGITAEELERQVEKYQE